MTKPSMSTFPCYRTHWFQAPYGLQGCMHTDSFVDFGTIYIVYLLTFLLTALLIYFLMHRPVTFPGRRS